MNELHQERDRLPRTIILVIIVSGVVTTAVGVFVAWAITQSGPLPRPAADLREREEVNELELRSFDEESAATEQWYRDGERLARYGWVDRSQGLVHLPIETAMELYLAGRPGTGGVPERTAERPDPGELEEDQNGQEGQEPQP